MKSTRASGLVLAGALGLGGLGVGAALGPVAASAATSSTQTLSSRVTAITKALAGLVKDGTITQTQADKVASTLGSSLPDGDFGGHGPGFGHGADLDSAAGVIGLTTDQLRTQLQSGKTLAQIAQGKGISQSTLVSKLVAAEKARIANAVKAGQLSQAQADSMTAGLTARVTQEVTSTCADGGPGGHRHGDFDGDGPGGVSGGSGGSSTSPSTPSTPTSPTPTPSASSSTT